MNDEPLYAIWSHEHSAWWGPHGLGYAQALGAAGAYTREEALRICALRICARAIPGTADRLGAWPELPVRLDDVKAVLQAYDRAYAPRSEPWR